MKPEEITWTRTHHTHSRATDPNTTYYRHFRALKQPGPGRAVKDDGTWLHRRKGEWNYSLHSRASDGTAAMRAELDRAYAAPQDTARPSAPNSLEGERVASPERSCGGGVEHSWQQWMRFSSPTQWFWKCLNCGARTETDPRRRTGDPGPKDSTQAARNTGSSGTGRYCAQQSPPNDKEQIHVSEGMRTAGVKAWHSSADGDDRLEVAYRAMRAQEIQEQTKPLDDLLGTHRLREEDQSYTA